MRCDSQEGCQLEYDSVDEAVRGVRGGEEHNKHDDVLRIQDEEPSEEGTDDAADVLDKPHT